MNWEGTGKKYIIIVFYNDVEKFEWDVKMQIEE